MAASSPVGRGVRYAFGRGLDPRKKDGVRRHPFVFVFGALLHLAIAAALVSLLLEVLRLTPAAPARISLVVLQILGICSGLSLLARRMQDPVLQAISVPDDYLSAALVLIVLGTATASLLTPGGAIPFYVSTAALVLYAPFGKIRHCVLFFVTRARFGAFIGTRGVLIHRSHG